MPASVRRRRMSELRRCRARRPRCGRPASGRSPAITSPSSCWPLPSTPATPRISPARTVERQTVERAHAAIVHGDEALRPRARPRPARRCRRLDARSPRRGRPSAGPARAAWCRRSSSSAVTLPCAHHRDAVGDLHHLLELVGDEQDRVAGVAQLPEAVEKAIRSRPARGRSSVRRGSGSRRCDRAPSGSRPAGACPWAASRLGAVGSTSKPKPRLSSAMRLAWRRDRALQPRPSPSTMFSVTVSEFTSMKC